VDASSKVSVLAEFTRRHGWIQKDLKIRIILIHITDARCDDYMILGFLLPPTNGRFGVFF
jgi:hypothetical protein